MKKEKRNLTPEKGFNLVGIDYFSEPGNQLYVIEHFEMYQDALNAKKDRKNPEEYFILYKGTSGGNFSVDKSKSVELYKFYKLSYHQVKISKFGNETSDLIDTIL